MNRDGKITKKASILEQKKQYDRTFFYLFYLYSIHYPEKKKNLYLIYWYLSFLYLHSNL